MNDSSVILKKGNKEYFVSQGEKLEGIYELIEVNQNEIIFRENEKLYRINNLVGK
jgi:type II secretory pathway component PulC